MNSLSTRLQIAAAITGVNTGSAVCGKSKIVNFVNF